MAEKIYKLLDKVILFSFYTLFFLTPLILTPWNYELFEYNKMLFTYALTSIILASWIGKMVVAKKIYIRKTPFDIPLMTFLLANVISTIFSIDIHLSIWGYYSRLNGGLVSIISYLILFYAFVSNFPKDKINQLFKTSLTSGILVAIYGILEHFGIDKDIWVQDVQNRVFSTLGQPNWLAAYLDVLIFIVLGVWISKIINTAEANSNKIKKSKIKNQNENIKFQNIFSLKFLVYSLLFIVFYLTLIYTKSRSGFLGFWGAYLVFMILIIFQLKKAAFKILLIPTSIFLILNFLFGIPFEKIDKFTLRNLIQNKPSTSQDTEKPIPSTIEVGITESADLRKIVWKGAFDIFRNNLLSGTGPETFAFSYYKYRPMEHNMTSEWDFLYNKAHNEYLNTAANIGIFGIGSYLVFILFFNIWTFRQVKIQNPKTSTDITNKNNFILLTLLSAWISILITNFFGFSVVVLQHYFYLIPAIAFMVIHNKIDIDTDITKANLTIPQKTLLLLCLLFVIYVMLNIGRIWYADTLFNEGYKASRSGEYALSYQQIGKALVLNPNEPLYYDEYALPAAAIALAFAETNDSTSSSTLALQAVSASNFAINKSPNNINFLKSRARVFIALSSVDESYLGLARQALELAEKLAPTDPKITYNLGLLYEKTDSEEKSIEYFSKAVEMKKDYRDAYYALAVFYLRKNEIQKAKENLEFILEKLNPEDEDAIELLDKIK